MDTDSPLSTSVTERLLMADVYKRQSNPCPFTAADIDERLIGTTDFMPHSAIVCLFPYHVPHEGPTNLSRYTWATDYHLVVTDYLQRLVDELKTTAPDAVSYTHLDVYKRQIINAFHLYSFHSPML